MVKKGRLSFWTFSNHTSKSPLILHALTKTWYRSIKESLFSLVRHSLWISTPPCCLPLYSLRFFTKSTLSTIWTSTGNITGRCVQMQAFHWLPELHFHFWSEGSQWNACMLPVDVQIVERVHFMKKRREYRGKQQECVDIQREQTFLDRSVPSFCQCV